MSKLIFKRLDIEYILNINIKLNKSTRKNKFNNYIIAICLSIIVYLIIIDGLNLIYLLTFIYCLLVTLIIKQRNLIVFREILESVLKKDIKSIEFNKNNIKVCEGKNIIINSYNSLNLLIEYKNIIEIKYVPIKNSKEGEQILLIPKEIFKDKEELVLFKDYIISKINKENFKVYDNNFEIKDKIKINEKVKCIVYIISSISLMMYILFIVGYILI